MTDFFEMPDGRRIAFRLAESTANDKHAPTIVFLPGYMSDMAGSKATALFDWAQENGHACLLLDYSGCGESDGDFGGWLMLLAGLALGERLAGMVGIAAAPDFSDWGYSAEQKASLQAGETVLEDNPYGPEPTPTFAAFWADAQAQRQLDAPIAIDCPVTLLHGQRDADVPWQTALRLAKDGDHRLSRPEDVARLLAIVEQHLLSA